MGAQYIQPRQLLGFALGSRSMFRFTRRQTPGIRRTFWVFVTCAVALAGCHFKFKHAARARVLLQGHQSATERMIIAKRAAVAVWDKGELKRKVAARFPNLTPADLGGLYMKADDARVREAGKAREIVSILVFFQYTDKVSDPQRVADYCKSLLEKQLARDPDYKP